MTKLIGYIGTYSTGESKGLYSFTLDTETKTLSIPTVAAELQKPTYVAVSKDNKNLYSLIKEGDKSGVVSYMIDQTTGTLTLQTTQLSDGIPGCHVSVKSDNSIVFTANYHRGILEAYPVVDGALQPISSIAEHSGNGPHERQEKPHTHFAGLTLDEKYVVAIDLGADQVNTYSYEENDLKLKHTFHTHPGSGPRHITFHPNGQFAYIMTEISNEVIVLAYNDQDGSFTEIQAISTLPEGFTENAQGGAIHISSDGRFVYASNRGPDNLAVFSVDTSTGELTLVEHVSTEGNWPRDFVLDPTEQFIIASNQESDNITLYERDDKTGKLTLLQANIPVQNPVCVKFLHI